jgi:hypothetical protein
MVAVAFLELTEQVASWAGGRERRVLVNLRHVWKIEPHPDGGAVLFFSVDAGDRWETLHVRETPAAIASRMADLATALSGDNTMGRYSTIYRAIANV